MNRALEQRDHALQARAAFEQAQKLSADWDSTRKTADNLLNNWRYFFALICTDALVVSQSACMLHPSPEGV